MTVGILGKKVGMTRFFMEDGVNIPVTVIQAGPCAVTQVKTQETDGYCAVQLGFEEARPERASQPLMGHDAQAGVSPKRYHKEIRLAKDGDMTLGQVVTVAILEGTKFVDVVGVSKGKGFQGVMKRHHFKGMCASHGTERKHRSAGSISGHATNRGVGPKPKKGKGMPGHMGSDRVTARNLDVVRIDPEKNLLLVKGAVPGPNDGLVLVYTSKRLGRSKQLKAKGGKKKD